VQWTLTTFKGEAIRFGSGRAFWIPSWARPSLYPTPIAHAATTSEGASRTTIPDGWKIGEIERRENGVRGDEQGKVQAQADTERSDKLLDE
jgi:hypothetical protein